MSHSPPSKSAISQYSTTSSKLAQRAAILSYDTNPQSWYAWLSTRLPTANHDILEVGAGSGELWTHIDTCLAKSITLTDFSPAMCDKLREMRHQLHSTYSQSPSHPDIPIEIKKCDAASLPFGNGSFDLVIANHMLYHLNSPSTALAEFARVLRPGGALRVSLNGRDHISELLALGHQIGRPSPIVDAARINAETAGGMLERCFGDVRMERFPGGFEVRDVEAVVGYLGSWGEEGMTGPQEDEVRRVVGWRITEEGCFKVRKDMVLFSAVKG